MHKLILTSFISTKLPDGQFVSSQEERVIHGDRQTLEEIGEDLVQCVDNSERTYDRADLFDADGAKVGFLGAKDQYAIGTRKWKFVEG